MHYLLALMRFTRSVLIYEGVEMRNQSRIKYPKSSFTLFIYSVSAMLLGVVQYLRSYLKGFGKFIYLDI